MNYTSKDVHSSSDIRVESIKVTLSKKMNFFRASAEDTEIKLASFKDQFYNASFVDKLSTILVNPAYHPDNQKSKLALLKTQFLKERRDEYLILLILLTIILVGWIWIVFKITQNKFVEQINTMAVIKMISLAKTVDRVI